MSFRYRAVMLGALVFALVAGLVPTASGHGVSGGPLGPQQIDGPAGTALDVATADRCDPIDPHACLLPFPNDHFTRADTTTDTGLRLNLHPLSMPRNIAGKPIDPTEWNRNDGFSPGQMIVVKVPGLSETETALPRISDPGPSLSAASPVQVFNAGTGERHPVWAELDSTTDGTYGGGNVEGIMPPETPPLHDPANGQALLIRPAVNWEEGARYVVALRDLRDADGNVIPTGSTFAALADDDADDVEDLAFAARRAELHADVLPVAADAGNDLYLAWDFTVASERNLAERMLHMRDDAFASLGGGVPEYTITSIEENPQPELARRVRGEIQVPRYVSTPAPGARMVYDPITGLPLRQPTDQPATFRCDIPKSALSQPSRTSLYGHGLLGGQDELNSGVHRQFGNDFNWTYCATDWLGMASADLVTIVTQIVPDLSNFHLIADRGQQGMLNFLFLGRLMNDPNGFAADPAFQDGDGDALIQPNTLAYDGNSQGGIMGGSLAAVATDFTNAVLGVPGMNYSTLLRRSKDFDPFAALIYLNYTDELDRSVIFSLMQTLWDRAEANGYAHHMSDVPYGPLDSEDSRYVATPAHRILLHGGFGDHQVANVSMEVEARTIGAGIHRPAPPAYNSWDGVFGRDFWDLPSIAYGQQGSAMILWDSGTPVPPFTNSPPRAGNDPHETPRRDWNAQIQKDHFLRTGVVIDVCTSPQGDPYRGGALPPAAGSSCQTVKRDG